MVLQRGKGLWPALLTQSTFPFSDFLQSSVELHKLCRCVYFYYGGIILSNYGTSTHITHATSEQKQKRQADILRQVQREIKRTHTTHITTHFGCIALVVEKGLNGKLRTNLSLLWMSSSYSSHTCSLYTSLSYCHCTRNNGFFTLLCNMYLLTNTRGERFF